MKKLLTIGCVTVMVVSMAACGGSSAKDDLDKENKLEQVVATETDGNNTGGIDAQEETNEEFYITPTDDYAIGDIITAGSIMAFKGDTIHIISGDLVQVYSYDQNQAEQYYLGQEVQLIKGESQDTMEPLIIEDFDIKHTNMGQIIEFMSGRVIEVSKTSLTVMNEGQEIKVNTYEPQNVSKGSNVTMLYMNFTENEASLVVLLNEDSRLLLEVNEIRRGDQGEMLMSMTDKDGWEYEVSASSCLLELNMSEVMVGDLLTVYQNGIRESWPMQLDTVLIRR